MSDESFCKGKSEWPELVGENGQIAATIIERENPNVKAIVLPDGTAVIENFSCKRVWVWVDSDELVVRPPLIG
ncbi:inhibitor of trypsin and hageman factor-like [Amaranthus tricolor]|uniref:inhibitor of trypsin and hageman factor-like n=1 Tax=Amaranthus tricolor TaxID=29722 RepID=UPI002583A29E|nr:inhibitor of trypsin and hageman factor-like [Amaranthus tricolor]